MSVNKTPRAFPALVLVAMALVVFSLCAGIFASKQAIWVDETTQLTGLTLDFGTQLHWLAGLSDVVLGVPGDRMPPLSYWLGGLWAGLFGAGELSMRWFGIVITGLAVPPLFMAGRLAAGSLGGVFLVWLMLCAPSMVVQGVEIRAYPLFFTLSAWSVWAFARIAFGGAVARDWRDLAVLVLFSVLMAYAHYFGVVAAGCLFAGLFVQRLVTRGAVGAVVVAGLVALVLMAGLWPFVRSAIEMSGPGGQPPEPVGVLGALEDAARLGFRLFVHPVTLISLPLTALLLAGLAVLGLAAGTVLTRRGAARQAGIAVLVPLVLAFGVLTVLRTVIDGFNVLASHYNLWLMPLAGLALCLALRNIGDRPRWWRGLVGGAVAVVVAVQLASLALLVRNAEEYVHGSGEWVAGMIGDDPAGTLVIHDGAGVWGHAYFPIYFLTSGQVEQWLRAADGSLVRLSPTGREPLVDPQAEERRFTRVVELESRALDSRQRARIARGEKSCESVFGVGPKGPPTDAYCAIIGGAIWDKTPN